MRKCSARTVDGVHITKNTRWLSLVHTLLSKQACGCILASMKLKGKRTWTRATQHASCVELNKNILETWQTWETTCTFLPGGGRKTVSCSFQPGDYWASDIKFTIQLGKGKANYKLYCKFYFQGLASVFSRWEPGFCAMLRTVVLTLYMTKTKFKYLVFESTK